MDNVTREALLNLLRNLRQTADEPHQINEMAWRTYSALVAMFPDQFPGNYREANKRVSFEQLQNSRADQLRQLEGHSTSGDGVVGVSTSGSGVVGRSTKNGVVGQTTSDSDAGVNGRSDGKGFGVFGFGQSGWGVFGKSSNGTGVRGDSGSGIGVTGTSNSLNGVAGVSNDARFASIFGRHDQPGGAGVIGYARGQDGFGIYGRANNGENAVAVRGDSDTGLAGAFFGNVDVTKDLTVLGTLTAGNKLFKIDHPLDPANKFLVHAAMESPELANAYSGNITTDTNGEGIVSLPDYFEALNRDFRYQLTVIGQFSQAIVKTEIQNNRFTIKTDRPDVKVSWQVTEIRQDDHARAYPLVVEQYKPIAQRGLFLHPRIYGQPEEETLRGTLASTFIRHLHDNIE